MSRRLRAPASSARPVRVPLDASSRAEERVRIYRATAEAALAKAQDPATAPEDVAKLLVAAIKAMDSEEALAQAEERRRLGRSLLAAPSAEAAIRAMSTSTATPAPTLSAAHLRAQMGDATRARKRAQRDAREAHLEACRRGSEAAGVPFTEAEMTPPPPPTAAQTAAALRARARTPEMLRVGVHAGVVLEKQAADAAPQDDETERAEYLRRLTEREALRGS